MVHSLLLHPAGERSAEVLKKEINIRIFIYMQIDRVSH